MTRAVMIAAILAPVAMLAASCAHVKVDPIEVKPIYITMDVNIKVDRQLDQFFAFEDKTPAASSTTSSTAPTTRPATTLPSVSGG